MYRGEAANANFIVFGLTWPIDHCDGGEAANANFIVFGLTWPIDHCDGGEAANANVIVFGLTWPDLTWPIDHCDPYNEVEKEELSHLFSLLYWRTYHIPVAKYLINTVNLLENVLPAIKWDSGFGCILLQLIKSTSTKCISTNQACFPSLLLVIVS
jgi:hypothetical protein